MAILLRKRRVLAAKLEETAVGTAETLSATEGVFNVFDAEIQAEAEFHERPGQAGFSPLPGVVGARGGTLTFWLELCGSGVAESTGGESVPPWALAFLPACGLIQAGATSPVFNPSSLSPTIGATALAVRTITIGLFEDGLFKHLAGAMGTAVIRFTAGQPVRVEFTFRGVWQAPTTEGIISPTYGAVLPPRFGGSTISIGAWTSPVLAELSIDLGNNVILRPDAATAAGYLSALITGRRMIGTVNPETTPLATADPYADWLSSAEAALSLTIGVGDDGNSCTIAAPQLQWTDPKETDREGIAADELAFQLNRSADLGDDELSLTFA